MGKRRKESATHGVFHTRWYRSVPFAAAIGLAAQPTQIAIGTPPSPVKQPLTDYRQDAMNHQVDDSGSKGSAGNREHPGHDDALAPDPADTPGVLSCAHAQNRTGDGVRGRNRDAL